MRTVWRYSVIAAFTCVLLACGSGPLVIDVDLPVNQNSPFEQLTKNNGGIFFQFDLLVAQPNFVNDLDANGTSIRFPSGTLLLPPTSNTYDLTEVQLDPNRFYRVRMFGQFKGSTNPEYTAVGDCPLKRSLKTSNTIVLCLGASGTSPLCVDETLFKDCPK